jgi:hypothetical protein
MGLCQSGIAATQWVGCLSECQSRSAANRVGKKMLIHPGAEPGFGHRGGGSIFFSEERLEKSPALNEQSLYKHKHAGQVHCILHLLDVCELIMLSEPYKKC